MPELAQALARAHEALERMGVPRLEKTIWGSPMGKTTIARRIASEIPEHRTYVEPFAGGAAVLFAKAPSEVEVVADLDPEIAFAFRFAKAMTPEQLERLRRKKWVGDKAHFKRLEQAPVPDDPVEHFYRFAYLSRFSFNKLRRGAMPNENVGVEARFVDKLERRVQRLRKVQVRHNDYEAVIDAFDGPDTFFFLDPPYAGHNVDVRSGADHNHWDEARFGRVLRKIRGKFLCTYGLRGDKGLFKGLYVRRWRHATGVGSTQGVGLNQRITLVATNYDPSKVGPSKDAVAKTIWGSPAGKKRIAARLAAMLPPHRTYVEPFAGSAAVLFAKQPSELEVIGDADLEIAEAFRLIKTLKSDDLQRLRRMDWTGDEATFKRLLDAAPKDDAQKLHRFLYLSHFSYGKLRGRSFNPNSAGVRARTLERIEAFAPRLKHVRIHGGDYETLVKTYDAKDTLFFFDPPYAGYDVDVGEKAFDEERFFAMLKALKGKFLLTYGVRGKLPGLLKEAGFVIKRIRTPRSISAMRGVGGPTMLTQLVVANYNLIRKSDMLEPCDGALETRRDVNAAAFAKSIPLLKGVDPSDERFVLGIVLEPDVVDAQGDIYSAEEVRKAAHRFLDEFGSIGLMHRIRAGNQVRVLESYVALTDFRIGEVHVRKGTWLLAVRIDSDAIWAEVKAGSLTGFSIGGSARRVQEPEASEDGPTTPEEAR